MHEGLNLLQNGDSSFGCELILIEKVISYSRKGWVRVDCQPETFFGVTFGFAQIEKFVF